MKKIISNVDDVTQDPRTSPSMPRPQKVLMIRPTYLHIDNPINVHMRRPDGSAHILNHDIAMIQWEALRDTYQKLGFTTSILEGVDGLPDMCFAANQTLPYCDAQGNKVAILSNMANDTRHQEVDHVARFLAGEGYTPKTLDPRHPDTLFEGMGDCLWLPGHRFLLGGYGFRTSQSIYEKIAEITDTPVAIFELKDPKFYHLDACLSLLTEDTVLACRQAFTAEGWELLQALFPKIIEVPLEEADWPNFACNAHCPDKKHVIIQPGSSYTESQLRREGFEPIPIETSEFLKSGGSVFCLKLMYF